MNKNNLIINHQEQKFTEGWTEQKDNVLKSYHECNWDDSCVMCQNYDNCLNEYNKYV